MLNENIKISRKSKGLSQIESVYWCKLRHDLF